MQQTLFMTIPTETIIHVPARHSVSSIASTDCFIKADLTSTTLLKQHKHKVWFGKLWFGKDTKTLKIWKVYIPASIVILVIFTLIGAYAIHIANQNGETKDTLQTSSVQSTMLRRFDSRDGVYKQNTPLRPSEKAVYDQCESRFTELDVKEFLKADCSLCSKDYGIVSVNVMNLCIIGQFVQQESKKVCEWVGVNCNQDQEIISIQLNSISTPFHVTSDIMYLQNLKTISLQGIRGSFEPKDIALLPGQIFQLPELKRIEFTNLPLRVNFPTQNYGKKLSELYLDNIQVSELPSWLSTLPMEHFLLSNIALGIPPDWFKGSLWKDTIKSFQLMNCTMVPFPSFVFPTTTQVRIL